MSGTIRVESDQMLVAKQCLESEMDSIEGVVGSLEAMRGRLSDSWEGETASKASGVLTHAIATALLVQGEARGVLQGGPGGRSDVGGG